MTTRSKSLTLIKSKLATTVKKKVLVVYNNSAYNRFKRKMTSPPKEPPKTDVYILELEDDKIYVGKTNNMDKRLGEHMNHTGSAFTKRYKPTGRTLERLGNVHGDGDAAERDETLRYMYYKGIENVRGWRYTQVHLSKSHIKDAEENIREMFDLCRKCGLPGHFIQKCKSKVDRLGNALG